MPVLSVLTYHHVFEPSSSYRFDPAVADASPKQFREHLELLARHCTAIGIDDVCAALDGAPLPKNPLLLTFDDGYRSNIETALPILKSVGMKAAFFIATSFVTERRMYWWEAIAYLVKQAKKRQISLSYPALHTFDLSDQAGSAFNLSRVIKNTPGLDVDRFITSIAEAAGVEWNRDIERDLANELIMTWDQIREISAAGMDIESHCKHHRVLETVPRDELDDELLGSRLELEAQIGKPVRAVAYPVGRSIAKHGHIRDAVAAAGYKVGFTNSSGVNMMWPTMARGLVDRFDIKRISTDRDLSDSMLLAHIAVPPLGYKHPGSAEDSGR